MQIEIQGLALKVYLGYFAWEQKRKRKVVFNLKYKLKKTPNSKKDALEQTLDYNQLYKDLQNFLAKKKFSLLETLANEVADFLIQKPSLKWLEVECLKPLALANADMVLVRCEKENN